MVIHAQAKYAALRTANYTTLEKAKFGADEGLLKFIETIEAELFPYKFKNQGMSPTHQCKHALSSIQLMSPFSHSCSPVP